MEINATTYARARLRHADELAHQLQLDLDRLVGTLESGDEGARAAAALAQADVNAARIRLEWLSRWLTPDGAGGVDTALAPTAGPSVRGTTGERAA